jgi:hypothetical protein
MSLLGPFQVFVGLLVLAVGSSGDSLALILVGALVASVGVALGLSDTRRERDRGSVGGTTDMNTAPGGER